MNEKSTNKSEKRIRKNKKRRNFVRNWIAITLAAIIGVAFVVNMIVPSKTFSEEENRNLEQRPKFSLNAVLSGDYFEDLENYYSDQFVLRDTWIRIKCRIQKMAGVKEISGVYLGKSGYLIQDLVSPSETTDEIADAINSFSSNFSNLKVNTLIVPGAAAIQKDKLPKGAPVSNQCDDIENFQKKLNSKVNVLDAITPLEENSDEYIYYRTDHHWTSLGAKYVFDANCRNLGIDSAVNDYLNYTISDNFRGTLSSKTGSLGKEDAIEIYDPVGAEVQYYITYSDSEEQTASLYDSSRLEEKDQYTVFMGGNHPVTEIHTTALSGKSLLIFKDSYANSFVQFLYPYYDNIVLIDPRYYYDNAYSLIREDDITDVLILYSANTLFEDRSLADCLNAVINNGGTEEISEELSENETIE